MKIICEHLKNEHSEVKVPVILFTKGADKWNEKIVEADCDAISIDWNSNIGQVRERIGKRVAIQGNMEPRILKESEKKIVDEVESILRSYGSGSGHVFNLGHGITPDIEPDKVGILVDAVHNLSRQYHKTK